MLSYFLPDFNNYTIRTEQIPANATYLRVSFQNMMTNENYSFAANPGQWTYEPFESIVNISFNLDIPMNVNPGDEWRMFFSPGVLSGSVVTYGEPVWHGSIQVYASQSVSKPDYLNQNTQYISHISDNTYAILE